MKIKFERFMRILARFIIVFIIDFLTLRKLIESYEMKVSIRVFCAGILFLIIWLASIWIKEDDNTNKPSSPLKRLKKYIQDYPG